MNHNFKNLEELRAHIAILKQDNIEQRLYLDQKVKHYKGKFKNPFSFITDAFKNFNNPNYGNHSSSDFVTNLARAFFPIVLNKTIFRKRGLFLKTLVSLVSQKAINANTINKDILALWIDKATEFFSSKTNKSSKNKDYGIPEDSETY